MPIHRTDLPQLSGGLFLADAGMETDMIFNRGFELPAFASHTLLDSEAGRDALTDYFHAFLALADACDLGFIIDAPVWRAQRYFAGELGVAPEALEAINHRAVAFAADLRRDFATNRQPIVVNAAIGPRGDAYAPENWISAEAAEAYHSEQLGWLAGTDVDIATALTFTSSAEAIGFVRAARKHGLPAAVSFTVETDGRLPTGQPLGEAIAEVDAATDGATLYFMVNCAHPEHLMPALDGGAWQARLKGLRCNASRMSHAELDCCESLDDGDPEELSDDYEVLLARLPSLSILGGCCGTDLRHVTAIARRITAGRAAQSAAVG